MSGRVGLVINVVFFKIKKNCKGKIKFCRVGADAKMSESRFQNNF